MSAMRHQPAGLHHLVRQGPRQNGVDQRGKVAVIALDLFKAGFGQPVNAARHLGHDVGGSAAVPVTRDLSYHRPRRQRPHPDPLSLRTLDHHGQPAPLQKEHVS